MYKVFILYWIFILFIVLISHISLADDEGPQSCQIRNACSRYFSTLQCTTELKASIPLINTLLNH